MKNKKIILIDDNSKNQRIEYNATFVDEEQYEDCLMHVEHLNSESDFSFLENAICIMIHDSFEDFIDGSFHKDSHKAKEIVEDFIAKTDIPFASFSDGHSITADWREDTPNSLYQIKKSEFYLHLQPFLDYYRENGKLDFRILAYGKNYIKELMYNWCFSVLSNLGNAKDTDVLSVSMVDRKSLRLIIENSQPTIGVEFNDLMCDIEDRNITVGQLRTNINNFIGNFRKYGKNISSWK